VDGQILGRRGPTGSTDRGGRTSPRTARTDWFGGPGWTGKASDVAADWFDGPGTRPRTRPWSRRTPRRFRRRLGAGRRGQGGPGPRPGGGRGPGPLAEPPRLSVGKPARPSARVCPHSSRGAAGSGRSGWTGRSSDVAADSFGGPGKRPRARPRRSSRGFRRRLDAGRRGQRGPGPRPGRRPWPRRRPLGAHPGLSVGKPARPSARVCPHSISRRRTTRSPSAN